MPEIKALMLEMLDEIDSFCLQENIPYFLVGGSLLGAIRHNGFIPWDDDIDIGIKRSDYQKFISKFESKSGLVKIIDHNNTPNYFWAFAKAVHTKTLLIEYGCETCPIGVYIDVFPIDVAGKDYQTAVKKVKKVKFYKRIFLIKKMRVNKKRSFLKNAIIVCLSGLKLIPDKWFLNKINKICAKAYSPADNKYLCNFLGAWGKREIMESDCFDGIIRHKFEDREYNILSNYDKYLSTLYGDYMTPPPPEKQTSHHNNKIFWK